MNLTDLDALNDLTPNQLRKISRAESTLNQFLHLLDKLPSSARRRIVPALELMIRLHITQKNRLDGTPYITHPLTVAMTLLDTLDITDPEIIITALLHDTVEDQSLKLIKLYLKATHQTRPEWLDQATTPIRRVQDYALREIGRQFGPEIRRNIRKLSNPKSESSYPNAVPSREFKNRAYFHHIMETVNDPTVCTVKVADLLHNTLTIHELPKKEYHSKCKKYGPVIRDILLPMCDTISYSHPLYPHRKYIREVLQNYYEQYMAPILDGKSYME